MSGISPWPVIRSGHRNHPVRTLQHLLRAHGQGIAANGVFGPETLPPISFPGRPERWWGDEALKAETDAPQATLKQRHQAAGDVLALRRRGFFSAGALFSMASHIPVETAQ